jgi:hypothetical protein
MESKFWKEEEWKDKERKKLEWMKEETNKIK